MIDFCCFGGGLEYLIWYAGSEAVTHFYALCIFMIIVLSSPVYGFYDSKWFSRSVGHYFMSRFFFIENGVFFHFLEGCNKWNFLWCESEEISQRFHRRENENIFLRTTFHEAHPLLEKNTHYYIPLFLSCVRNWTNSASLLGDCHRAKKSQIQSSLVLSDSNQT